MIIIPHYREKHCSQLEGPLSHAPHAAAKHTAEKKQGKKSNAKSLHPAVAHPTFILHRCVPVLTFRLHFVPPFFFFSPVKGRNDPSLPGFLALGEQHLKRKPSVSGS